MSYEIDFIGVSADLCKTDADAICLRWHCKNKNGQSFYKIGVVDGGFEAHGYEMTKHLNKYYFNDSANHLSRHEKTIDFIVVTHADSDHTIGLKTILKNFNVKKIYMNRPWLYIDELYDKVFDGRITRNSLKQRIYDNYNTILDIERIAKQYNIPILDAFEGTKIENAFIILSPSKQFYIDLLAESSKTPCESEKSQNISAMFNNIFAEKTYDYDLFDSWHSENLHEDVTTTAENETSVVMMGLIDGSGLLLTGDAGIRALCNAMEYSEKIGENIRKKISFYQIPHHGGRNNLSPSILNRMIGDIVDKGVITDKVAFASVADGSDHPLKVIVNSYVKRGVRTYKTEGNTINYHTNDMPERNWVDINELYYSNYVETWN